MKPSSKKDSCGICGRKTMANAVLCKFCENCIHGRCANIKSVTNKFAIEFICRKCKGFHENMQDQKEKMHYDVETVTVFFHIYAIR